MMNLETQLITLLISTLFGFTFSLIIDLIHKYLFKLKKNIQIITTFLLIIFSSIVYFLILLNLNNGIIHPYYIFAFIIGFFIEILFKRFLKKIPFFKK